MTDNLTRVISSVDESIEIRRLSPDEICLIGNIDRSEHVNALYTVENEQLVHRLVGIDAPSWNRDSAGEHSVGTLIEHWRPVVVDGADLLGAYDQNEFLGLVIVDGAFEPGMARLAFLHVSRPHRRRGVASALWLAAEKVAADAGVKAMYVSATPSDSAVGFYLSRGCRLANPPHPDLLAEEPEDIHFVCPID
jgi:ribosomal protein S18 acetylase RimI-like enzyme